MEQQPKYQSPKELAELAHFEVVKIIESGASPSDVNTTIDGLHETMRPPTCDLFWDMVKQYYTHLPYAE